MNDIKFIYGGEIITNGRFTLSNNKELDIYIPEKNLAIKFNSCYWYPNLCILNNCHQNKSKECLNKEGFVLFIYIYEDEWVYKQDINIINLVNINLQNY